MKAYLTLTSILFFILIALGCNSNDESTKSDYGISVEDKYLDTLLSKEMYRITNSANNDFSDLKNGIKKLNHGVEVYDSKILIRGTKINWIGEIDNKPYYFGQILDSASEKYANYTIKYWKNRLTSSLEGLSEKTPFRTYKNGDLKDGFIFEFNRHQISLYWILNDNSDNYQVAIVIT